MADSYSKKENNKKKVKKQQDKQLRRDDRKANNNKGKSLEDMLVYVDKNGNLTSTPPHLQQTEPANEKNSKSHDNSNAELSTGLITFIQEKGFGFIAEDNTRDNVFFNFDPQNTKFKRNLRVQFQKEFSPKGYRAIQVVIIN